jgi:hypothetical protein
MLSRIDDRGCTFVQPCPIRRLNFASEPEFVYTKERLGPLRKEIIRLTAPVLCVFLGMTARERTQSTYRGRVEI